MWLILCTSCGVGGHWVIPLWDQPCSQEVKSLNPPGGKHWQIERWPDHSDGYILSKNVGNENKVCPIQRSFHSIWPKGIQAVVDGEKIQDLLRPVALLRIFLSRGDHVSPLPLLCAPSCPFLAPLQPCPPRRRWAELKCVRPERSHARFPPCTDFRLTARWCSGDCARRALHMTEVWLLRSPRGYVERGFPCPTAQAPRCARQWPRRSQPCAAGLLLKLSLLWHTSSGSISSQNPLCQLGMITELTSPVMARISQKQCM